MTRLARKATAKLSASNSKGGMPDVRVVSKARQDHRNTAITPMAVAEAADLGGVSVLVDVVACVMGPAR
ncbi:hypothetical protein PproGo58_21500 [Pseudomonas protegens]|nr:hypothetical protein PproGo58_21500 [Pseudomonas protegens]